jgi:hypothetical protein
MLIFDILKFLQIGYIFALYLLEPELHLLNFLVERLVVLLDAEQFFLSPLLFFFVLFLLLLLRF